MSEHPATFRLDAIAAGDRDERAAEHVATCSGCRAYVEKATTLALEFAATEGTKSSDFVLALDDRRASEDRAAPPRRRTGLAHAGWLAAAGAMTAAAAVVLVARGGFEIGSSSPPSNQPAVRFKGKLQVAVIRDRVSEQSRIVGEVRVRPGDRLRAEVSVDDTRPIEVGFLGKDGTWVPLHAPALVEAGTYFSERAAQFDASPTEGWVIAGRPEDVVLARKTRSFDDVAAVPVIAEP